MLHITEIQFNLFVEKVKLFLGGVLLFQAHEQALRQIQEDREAVLIRKVPLGSRPAQKEAKQFHKILASRVQQVRVQHILIQIHVCSRSLFISFQFWQVEGELHQTQ